MILILGAVVLGYSCNASKNSSISPFTRRVNNDNENIRINKSGFFSFLKSKNDWNSDFGKRKKVKGIQFNRFSATKSRYGKIIKGNGSGKGGTKTTGGRKK